MQSQVMLLILWIAGGFQHRNVNALKTQSYLLRRPSSDTESERVGSDTTYTLQYSFLELGCGQTPILKGLGSLVLIPDIGTCIWIMIYFWVWLKARFRIESRQTSSFSEKNWCEHVHLHVEVMAAPHASGGGFAFFHRPRPPRSSYEKKPLTATSLVLGGGGVGRSGISSHHSHAPRCGEQQEASPARRRREKD